MHLPKLRKCWLLVCIQLILITTFIIRAVVFDKSASRNVIGGVNFIKQSFQATASAPTAWELKNVGNFTKNFALIRLNDGYTNHEKVCFREGTRNDTRDVEGEFYPVCSCTPHWHGKDCGQPEVLWRAFMTTTKETLKLSAPRKVPHNVFYLISSNGFSLQTLEIQMMELEQVVDLFVLCDLESHAPDRDFHLSSHSSTGFLKQYQDRILLFVDQACSPQTMYHRLKAFIPPRHIHRDDVIIFSGPNEILNHRAINFLKWYNNWPQPVKFRLKHNVYGFFWQHPENTIVSSVASTVGMLEDSYQSDPGRMMDAPKPGLIVGDLNHLGGWFCEFCAQSVDIVRQIVLGKRESLARKQTINADFIQGLIVNGLYIDGKLELVQLRRYQEKYFCPDYVEKSSWKFDNLLINIFAKWEEDYEDS